MEISVFLDDYRTCPTGYVLALNIDECIDLLSNNDVDHLSLDHDLVSKFRTGYVLVKHMVKHKLFANRITIHSANSVGGKAMYHYLLQAQKDDIMPKNIKVILRPLPIIY
ncbi:MULTISPECIES: cyclic-phosphate processing receiver domain-containing protein [Bacillus]|uniref:cyclic-phosphate processing receiver domain-containing protein n=1 Tax=Bacillus TaxID=1386 RepID=UPI000BB81A0E|nr:MULTISPECIES: cyclic-phosphate processing receiver domain-containing protein [Bacillus]